MSFGLIASYARAGLSRFSPKSILDLGCGNGIYGAVLREDGAELFGVDLSRESVELCKSAGYDQVILCPADQIEYEDEMFDMVFSSEVIEHVDDYERMLKEIHRVLKSGGGFVLTTTCYSTSIYQFIMALNMGKSNLRDLAPNLIRYIKGFFSNKERSAFVRKWCFEPLGGHYHGFIPRELKENIKRAGFDVLKSGVFYVVEPFPLVQNYNLKQCFFESKKSWKKRLILLFLLLISYPFNLVAKTFRLLGNNVYFIARKG